MPPSVKATVINMRTNCTRQDAILWGRIILAVVIGIVIALALSACAPIPLGNCERSRIVCVQ